MYIPSLANAYYRAVIPLQELEQRGHTVVWPTKPDSVPLREFLTCDLVHCYRRTDRLADLRALSERGVAISFDNDDDYSAAEVGDRAEGLKGRRENQHVHREIMQAAKLADLMTTPSRPLAEGYCTGGIDNVVVIENRLRRDTFGFGSRSKHDGVVVGWVAGREHRLDIERIPIVDALRHLLEAHPQLRILTVGIRLPLDSARYEHVAGVKFHDLLKATSRMDIGIAPLADTTFNRARSDVKLKEYGSGGAMWLASPVGPYRKLGEKEGGLLVGDDDWSTAIDALVRSPRRRRRLASRALKWAKAQTIDHHVDKWEDAFLGARERADRRLQTSRAIGG
jgi:hypothetical protein